MKTTVPGGIDRRTASSAGPLPPNKPLTNIASKKGGVCPKLTKLDVVINVATATATTGIPYRRAADGSFHRRRRRFPIILGFPLPFDRVAPKLQLSIGPCQGNWRDATIALMNQREAAAIQIAGEGMGPAGVAGDEADPILEAAESVFDPVALAMASCKEAPPSCCG